jgi:RNA polymerase sigma-70 factor (ECF subfamily)
MLKPPVDLIAAASAGDVRSTEMLLELAWPEAYRIARSIFGERMSAEDAAQEACARALISIHTLQQPERFSTWFYRIVTNEAMSQYRKQRRDVAVIDAGESRTDLHEERVDIRRAIDRLPVHLRAIVVLFYYADLTTYEIADVMGVTPVAVRLRLMIARRRLRPLLSDAPAESMPHTRKGEARSHEQGSA